MERSVAHLEVQQREVLVRGSKAFLDDFFQHIIHYCENVTGAGIEVSVGNVGPRYSYVCFRLSEEPSRQLEERLESLGVECVMPGGENEVYGIIDERQMSLSVLNEKLRKLKVSEVISIEAREPTAGK